MTTATVQGGVDLACLVEDHQRGVWRYLRYLGSDAAEADDLAQETFLAVLEIPFEIRSPRETASYLRTVARHKLLGLRRKQGRELATDDLETAEAVWAEVSAEDGLSDYLSALEDCLQSAVDERTRTALDARYRDGASRSELAEHLQLTEQGVKTMLRRARQALRECVERKVKQ
jgi:RNA polymerase sigma-70 factor (ECF subfamily)